MMTEIQTSSVSSNEKGAEAAVEHHDVHSTPGDYWYDRKLFGVLPAYSGAMFQVVMLAFVVFMTPGMFNALTGLGGSGIDDIKVADNGNVALYLTFATIGFFGGSICNIIGAKACLAFGGTGYALYAGLLLCWQHQRNPGFVIFGGAYLGVCAGCLWAAQGSIILLYPTEERKGTAIMVFWIIFNLGAVIGSIIPLAANMENRDGNATTSTFIAFLVLMCCGLLIALLMLPVEKVWRLDGTRVKLEQYPGWRDELKALYKLLRHEPQIFMLFPMFFALNWFYTYQFNAVNAARFNIRTRSLNSLLYWAAQMLGASILGSLLDARRWRRSTRARVGWAICFVVGMAVFGGGWAFQKGNTRATAAAALASVKGLSSTNGLIDFKQGKYIGPMFLYIFYGCYDAMYQTMILWTMGALSNNPRKTSLYAGFYKGIQSAGAGIVWRMDALEKLYVTLFATSWALPIAGLFIAAPLICFRVKDHTEVIDDVLDEKDLDLKSIKSLRSGVENPVENPALAA